MEVPWIIVSLWTRAVWGQLPHYLADEHRPLWILEDGLAKRHRQNRPEADYETTTRIPAALMVRRQGRGGGQEAESGSITFLVRHDDRDAPSAPPPKQPSLPKRRFMMPHENFSPFHPAGDHTQFL